MYKFKGKGGKATIKARQETYYNCERLVLGCIEGSKI